LARRSPAFAKIKEKSYMARLPTRFDTLQNLQQALDSFRTSSWLDAGLSGGGAYPPINVFRKGDDFALIAEVPGVKKSDIEVQVKGRTVRISGSKSFDYPAGSAVHRRERLSGRFDRALSLPFEIDAERVQAECRDGVLALMLTRAEHDKPRTIKVS
jgi:HSP20 family protein